jgi:hypothetical protein
MAEDGASTAAMGTPSAPAVSANSTDDGANLAAGCEGFQQLKVGTRFTFHFEEGSMEGLIVAMGKTTPASQNEGGWLKVRMWDGSRLSLCFETASFGTNWKISTPEEIAAAGKFPGKNAVECFWEDIWPRLEAKNWRIVKGHRQSDK